MWGFASEVVLQPKRHRPICDAVERQLARERGHAVRPHRCVAADDRPHDVFCQFPETSPVRGESHRGSFPDGVIHAGQHLNAEERAGDRGVQQADCADGPGWPVGPGGSATRPCPPVAQRPVVVGQLRDGVG